MTQQELEALKEGDPVEFHPALLSRDGLFLGGNVGPYGPWQPGWFGGSFGRHGSVWVVYQATDQRGLPMPNYLAGTHVDGRDCLRAAPAGFSGRMPPTTATTTGRNGSSVPAPRL